MCGRGVSFFLLCYSDHRNLHVLTHSFPTRRSSDLQTARAMSGGSQGQQLTARQLKDAADSRARDRVAVRIREGKQSLNNGQQGQQGQQQQRSEEHTSELQQLMRI